VAELGDVEARTRAATTFDRNVVVTASAGTGKTTLLVDRLVHLIVKSPDPVPLSAVVALRLPEVGGLSGLIAHPGVRGKLALLPDFTDWNTALAVFVIPLAVQWWSTWYPGAEPGGGGYVAQRIFSAKDEKHSLAATLWFNLAHYAVRPWPWILAARSIAVTVSSPRSAESLP